MPTAIPTMKEKDVNLEIIPGNVPIVEIDKLNVYSKGAHILKNVLLRSYSLKTFSLSKRSFIASHSLSAFCQPGLVTQ